MRTILYISFLDILYGAFGNAAQVVHIVIPKQLDCQQRNLLLLFSHLFIGMSLYALMFAALDRFLHVMLLNRYKGVITPAKYHSILTIYLFVAVGKAVVVHFVELSTAKYFSRVSILFVAGTISIYIVSIVKLKIYQKVSTIVSANIRNLNILVTAFLAIITLTYTPVLVYTLFLDNIVKLIGAGNTTILHHSLLMFSGLSSSLNAFAYLKLNVKARRKISSMIHNHVKVVNNEIAEPGA